VAGGIGPSALITGRRARGRAVQVDPIKPTLKTPGPMRLKLKCGKLLSSFAFKSNLRRYNVVHERRPGGVRGRAVQVDPMKPKLKPPGTKRLKLKL